MSAHQLQIGAERLATLPSGVLVDVVWERCRSTHDGWLMHPEHEQKRVSWLRVPLHLVLDDIVTAAVVAARIVRPWLMEQGSRSGREFGDVEALAEHHGSLSAALLMEPLTPDQREELTRLARAAMEGA